jgi:hypothetical protein
MKKKRKRVAVDLDDEKVIAVWVSFGPRSAIERLFRDIDFRIRRFWNGFIENTTETAWSNG